MGRRGNPVPILVDNGADSWFNRMGFSTCCLFGHRKLQPPPSPHTRPSWGRSVSPPHRRSLDKHSFLVELIWMPIYWRVVLCQQSPLFFTGCPLGLFGALLLAPVIAAVGVPMEALPPSALSPYYSGGHFHLAHPEMGIRGVLPCTQVWPLAPPLQAGWHSQSPPPLPPPPPERSGASWRRWPPGLRHSNFSPQGGPRGKGRPLSSGPLLTQGFPGPPSKQPPLHC